MNRIEFKKNLKDWKWRINNLYWIQNDKGQKLCFRMNPVQEELFDGMHYKNIILKARQFGITTFVAILYLDAVLWRKNITCGLVTHKLDDSIDIFIKKVRFAYDNLPDWLRAEKPALRKDGQNLVIDHRNGDVSNFRVNTSLRSGTYQYIHISEFGKICASDPKKANEIISGTLNAGANAVISIESTAEGKYGHFYTMCQTAEDKRRRGSYLTKEDFRFFFFPWYLHSEYRLSDEDCKHVVLDSETIEYFRVLDLDCISFNQMAWYQKKRESQLDMMWQEFPSTSEEAFSKPLKGSYYATKLVKSGIGLFEYDELYPVMTAWDIGHSDDTAIWFFQVIGGRCRLIDFYSNNEEGLAHYVNILHEKDYVYGYHIGPHDLGVTEWGSGKTRLETGLEMGLRWRIAPSMSVLEGINAVRRLLPLCDFNESTTVPGVTALRAYRKEWNAKHEVWSNKPYHNWASNPADAFRYLALGIDLTVEEELTRVVGGKVIDKGLVD